MLGAVVAVVLRRALRVSGEVNDGMNDVLAEIYGAAEVMIVNLNPRGSESLQSSSLNISS